MAFVKEYKGESNHRATPAFKQNISAITDADDLDRQYSSCVLTGSAILGEFEWVKPGWKITISGHVNGTWFCTSTFDSGSSKFIDISKDYDGIISMPTTTLLEAYMHEPMTVEAKGAEGLTLETKLPQTKEEFGQNTSAWNRTPFTWSHDYKNVLTKEN